MRRKQKFISEPENHIDNPLPLPPHPPPPPPLPLHPPEPLRRNLSAGTSPPEPLRRAFWLAFFFFFCKNQLAHIFVFRSQKALGVLGGAPGVFRKRLDGHWESHGEPLGTSGGACGNAWGSQKGSRTRKRQKRGPKRPEGATGVARRPPEASNANSFLDKTCAMTTLMMRQIRSAFAKPIKCFRYNLHGYEYSAGAFLACFTMCKIGLT